MRRTRVSVLASVLLPLLAALAGGVPHADLESLEPDVRRAAAERLSEVSDPTALGELIRAVRREEDPAIRRLMVVALGRIGDRRAIWDLMRLVDDSNGAALWSIRTILDGAPPCLADDAVSLASLERTHGERMRAWWKGLSGKNNFSPHAVLLSTAGPEGALLRDLRSGDERVALRAAERLRPRRLTLDELRLQASLLARHPRSWSLQALGRPLGTVDFPTLWARLSASGLTEDDCQGRTHWALTPDAIPVLVALLPEANEEWHREFLSLLAWLARDTDRFRLDAARGFAYALARIESETHGTPPPDISKIRVELPGDGLPPAFVALVRSRVLTERPEEDRSLASWTPPLPWLHRWARDLRPKASDAPFLLEVVRKAKDLPDRAWAVRALGRIADPAATKHLDELAAGEDDLAVFAAAERARDGSPVRFRALLARKPGDEIATMLAFEVLPEVAVRLWLEELVRPVSEDDEEDDWGRALFDPGASEDAERFATWGVRMREQDREALAAAFPVNRVTVERMAWFLSEVSASPLNGVARDHVLRRLREHEIDEEFDFDPNLTNLLGLLEVRAPKKLVGLLHHWVDQREGLQREMALLLLGRLGDTRFVPEMIEVWRRSDDDPGETDWLGRVKDPRVGALLERRVRSDEPDAGPSALAALAVRHGLPARLALEFETFAPEPERPETFRAARIRLLGGDALGAVLMLLEANPGPGIAELGTVDDPRALAALRKFRDGREHRWEAVAGLVLAGDEDARRELAGLFRDGRTWVFYPHVDGRVFTFGLDPQWVEFWIDRIDATCCIGFSALEGLGPLFPTLRMNGFAGRPEVKAMARDWWRAHRDHMAYSRILDGWVPSR